MKNNQLIQIIIIASILVTYTNAYLSDINNPSQDPSDITGFHAWLYNWFLSYMQAGIAACCFHMGGITSFFTNDGGYFAGFCIDRFLGESMDGPSFFWVANV